MYRTAIVVVLFTSACAPSQPEAAASPVETTAAEEASAERSALTQTEAPEEAAAEAAQAATGETTGQEGDEPDHDEFDPIQNMAERGVAEALNAIDEGRLQSLYIGEPAPDDYVDPGTGLPGGSMGCESDGETEAYVESFNRTLTTWWAENSPFLDGGTVLFTRRGAGENLRVEVAGDVVTVAHGAGILQAVDSGLDERLSVGAFIARARLDGADGGQVTGAVDSIMVGDWSVRWAQGTPPPFDERALRILEEFAGRPH